MSIVFHHPGRLEAKKTAFPYQVQAVESVRDLPYAAIFHEPGLGKTKIAVDLMLYWLAMGRVDTVLVITKKQLVANWIGELQDHTFLRPTILNADKRNNFFVLNGTARVVVTNFEMVSTEKRRILLFAKTRKVGVIIDESTKIKNPDSRLTRDFFDLSPLCAVKVIMTGTPVANRPYDIWAQVYFLDQGKSLGTDFKAFKRETDLSNELSSDPIASDAFEDAVASIFDRVRHFSIRETKKTAGIVLPDKVYETVVAKMEPLQRSIYDKIVQDMQLEVERDGAVVLDDDSAALKRLLRLDQIASNPKLVDERYNKVPCKEKLLEDLLSKIIAEGEKCIVWSCFIENVDWFWKKYAQYKPRRIHGKLSIDDRDMAVKVFKTNPECKVLFATPQAAKEGLTLTVANHVVFYDRGFNLDDYLQAQDRIHRISQKKVCYVYNLMAADSIDQWVDQLLQAKQRAAFLAQGDMNREDYAKVADYSYGDLIRQILSGRNGI
ncbi:MAG: DEAD/DEAH box helicase [Kiritimatiellae bacterium]|nr:DEAD/DEAH box helicase [Kiritimatiellia bacterium]